MDNGGKALAAFVVFLVVLAGWAAIGSDWTIKDPSTTTTVVTAAVAKGEGTQKTTTVTTRDRGRPTRTVTTIESAPGAAAQPRKTVTTTVAGGKGVLERVFGAGGLIILRLGAIVLVAFLAGALVQRMLLGQYAIKVGPLELPAIADKAAEGLAGLSKKIDADSASMKGDLAVLYARLAELEKKVPGG
jgi:hypothetical protein